MCAIREAIQIIIIYKIQFTVIHKLQDVYEGETKSWRRGLVVFVQVVASFSNLVLHSFPIIHCQL